jgi:hypothetical protein
VGRDLSPWTSLPSLPSPVRFVILSYVCLHHPEHVSLCTHRKQRMCRHALRRCHPLREWSPSHPRPRASSPSALRPNRSLRLLAPKYEIQFHELLLSSLCICLWLTAAADAVGAVRGTEWTSLRAAASAGGPESPRAVAHIVGNHSLFSLPVL